MRGAFYIVKDVLQRQNARVAIFMLRVGVVSRGNTRRLTARSAVAAAAYQARTALFDESRKETHDFTADAAALVREEIMLPDLAPYRWFDREVLWNEVEARERQPNSQVARSVVLTLPRELDAQVGADLARDFFGRAFVARGMVVDMAVHTKTASDGGEQPHAHALLTMRRIADGAFGLKERAWNSASLLKQWREQWAGMANRALDAAGVLARVDHRAWAARRERVAEFASLARGVAIIGAAITTQAMRDAARRWRRGPKEKRTVPLDASAPRAPVDVLREELRRPLRTAAVGVAAGVWSYGEAVDRLVGEHLLSAVKRYPELEPRFEDLEGKIGDALAKATEKVERQIAGNAAILRARSPGSSVTTQAMRDVARAATGRERTMVEQRDDAAYIEQVSRRLGVPNAAQVDRAMQTREFREMETQVQARIAASSTGEVGALSVERRTTRRAADHQTQHAHRRAHEADVARTHEHTAER